MKLDIQMFADGKVVIDTDLNRQGFEKGLDKIQSVAKAGFTGIATSVGIAATALTALVGKSVQAAGELEQQVGGAESVFKNLGQTIDEIKFQSFEDGEGQIMSLRDVAKDAFQTMGVSTNQYLATINKMGALMMGSGIETQRALDLSGQAMQRAADVASIMGIDINSAMESIAGAAKGNFTMMDNLGVAMNATTIEAYALSKGIEKSYTEMENAEKIELAMEMFLEKSAYATGNYVKENQTFAGSFTTLKASIENFLSGAGDIDDVIDSVMNFGEILIESITEMAPRVVEGIIKLINGIIPQLPPLLEKLLPVVIQGAVNLINGLVASLPTIIPILLNGIVSAFSQIVAVLPEILKALLDATLFIITSLSEQMPVLLPQIIDAILEIIPMLIDYLPLFVKAGFQLLTGIGIGLINALPSLIDKLPGIVLKIINYFRKLPDLMAEVGINLLVGLWKGIQSKWKDISDSISKLGNKIVDKFKSVFGIKSPSKVMKEQIGYNLATGIEVGFEDELDSVYRNMQNAINLEQEKLQASVETGRVFNTIQNSTPVAISVNGNVEMDSQKVGRLVTPTVTRTIKNGGGV